jgi:hypothetical protein
MSKEGKLALCLSPDQREVFLKKYNAKLCEPYGVVQPEYVVAFLYVGIKEVLRRQL